MASRRRTPRKNNHPPVVPGSQAVPPPKVVMRSMSELAEEAKLDGKDLSDFVEVQAKELQRLQIMNVKKNVQSLGLDKFELDAMLAVLDGRADKAELAVDILKHAAETGMQQPMIGQFAMKLARMGLHQ